MKHWLPLFLLALMLGMGSEARSQYTFQHEKRSYQPIDNGVALSMRWADTVNPYTYITLQGMTFSMYGEQYVIDDKHPMGISKWGNIEIFNDESVIIIDAFHSSIMDSLTPGTQVSALVEGMMGDRILKIQWKDMGFQGLPSEIKTNFQMWMYERTGNVEFHYGPHTLECIEDDPTLQGGYVGMFKATLDFEKFTNIFWVYGDPDAPKISKANIRAMDCPFDAGVVATIASPAASVWGEEENELQSGIYVERGGSIELRDARNVRLFSTMGHVVRSSGQVDELLSLDGVASGRYFIEYQREDETHRCTLIIE